MSKKNATLKVLRKRAWLMLTEWMEDILPIGEEVNVPLIKQVEIEKRPSSKVIYVGKTERHAPFTFNFIYKRLKKHPFLTLVDIKEQYNELASKASQAA